MFAGLGLSSMKWAGIGLLVAFMTLACHSISAPTPGPTVDIRINTFVYHTNVPLEAVGVQVNHRTVAVTDIHGTVLLGVPLGHPVTVSVEKAGYRAFFEAEETAVAYEVLGFWLEPDVPDASPR